MPRRHATPISRRCGGGVGGGGPSTSPHHIPMLARAPALPGRARATRGLVRGHPCPQCPSSHQPPPQSHAGEGAGAPREGTRHTRSGPRASLHAFSVTHTTHPQSHAGEGAGAPREGTRHTRPGPRASLPAFSVTHTTHHNPMPARAPALPGKARATRGPVCRSYAPLPTLDPRVWRWGVFPHQRVHPHHITPPHTRAGEGAGAPRRTRTRLPSPVATG